MNLDFDVAGRIYNFGEQMIRSRAAALRSLSNVRIVAKGSGHGPGHRRYSNGDLNLYKPTDTVGLTGIYEVIHDRGHRESHEVVMRAGDLFPSCDTCDMRVRFKLVRTAPYIFDDEDFERESG